MGSDAGRPLVRRVTTARWSVDRGLGGDLDADGADRGEPGCCASTSPPPPSATRWSAPWSGSLVEVGRGKENAAGLMERLRAVTAHRMPDPAPAHGLCLVSVAYGPGGGVPAA